MILQDKIDIFINKAQTKITELSLKVAEDLYEGYGDDTHAVLANELSDVISSLQSEQLDWSDYEIELALDYYNYKAKLSDIALINYADIITRISDNGTVVDSGWIDAFNSLQSTVIFNKQDADNKINDLQNQINNMDLSGLIPEELLGDIDDLKEDSHTHPNKSVLDGLTQSHVDSIGLNNDHRLNSSIHVTNTQKNSWDAKPTQQQLTDGLSGKSDVNHTHQISDVEGLAEALEVIEPEKGDKGDKGDTPIFSVGTVEIGEELQIDVDVSIPESPILNFTIPVGEDGEDFKIDVYGNASNRLKSLYDDEALGFNYLGTDTGLLYIRKPFAEDGVTPIPATTTSGWYQVKFAGDSGWSPILGTHIVSDTITVLRIVGWVGGTGNPPELGSNPNYPVYIGQYGLTYSLAEATNVKGAQGISGPSGKIMFPDQTDTFENRYLYDSEPRDFIFLDSVNGVIYRKLSESVGDWSEGFQWKGDQGAQGVQGEKGEQGIQGPKGYDGYTPIKGVDYFDGAQGPKGDTGEQGIQGIRGPKGDKGDDGYTPIKGVDYFDGVDGKDGPELGETSTTAYRGDRGKLAYDHSITVHAPSDAQKNSDITKSEIEAKLIGNITTHSHTVTKGDVGLGNVDNTSDLDKPISTATQAALNTKLNITKFNDLQIGGRNLISKSRLTDSGFNDQMQEDGMFNGIPKFVLTLGTYDHIDFVISPIDIELPAGTWLTLSFKVFVREFDAERNMQIVFYYWDNNMDQRTAWTEVDTDLRLPENQNKWIDIVFTFSLDYPMTKTGHIYFRSAPFFDVLTGDLDFTLPKLEIGNKATDWTPTLEEQVTDLTGLEEALNDKVDNSRVLTDVPVGAKFTDTVYTHPSTHPPSIITQDANNRFVSDSEKALWNAKGSSNLTLGSTSTTAYRGDRGTTAYNHSQSAHAPVNAQKNSDITKAEIEAKLTGNITTHSHTNAAALSNIESAAGATQSTINSLINARLFETIALSLSGYLEDAAIGSGDILNYLPYNFKAYELLAEFADAPRGSSAVVTFRKNYSYVGQVTVQAFAYSGSMVLDPPVSFARGDSLWVEVTQVGLSHPGGSVKAYIHGIKYQ